MATGEGLDNRLRDLRVSLEALPEVSEPPKPTLRILGLIRSEQKWNQLLAYFLDPTQPHGFGADLLKCFLDTAEQQTEKEYDYYHRDFETVKVDTELASPQNNIPDIVIRAPERWFICIESKVDASEGTRQTPRYVEDTHIGEEKKSEYPDDSRYYLFLSPKHRPDSEASEFEDLYWRDVVNAFNQHLRLSRGRYPNRSVSQLEDYTDAVAEVTNMEDDQFTETQKEKVRLLAEYKQDIDELVEATNQVRKQAIEDWTESFREQLNSDLWTDEWNARSSKWGTIHLDDWYLNDKLEPAETVSDTRGNDGVRLHFMHYIRNEESFLEGQLEYGLICNTRVPVREEFHRLFNSDDWQKEIAPILDERNIVNKGNKSEYTYKKYDVEQARLPESYFERLAVAFEEHLPVAGVADRILSEAVENVKND